MILNRKGETFTAGGKAFSVGGMVWSNGESDYRGMFGYVAEIRDGSDKETDNESTEIVCDFMVPTKPHMVREIESRFSMLYQTSKRIDDLPFGGVVMAPDMLEPVAGMLPESEGALYALVYTYDGESDSTIGMVGISQDKAVLMRAMFDDLNRFEEDEGYKAWQKILCKRYSTSSRVALWKQGGIWRTSPWRPLSRECGAVCAP